MAWENGIMIRGGRYADALIGISDNLVGGSQSATIGGVNDSAGQQVQGDPNVWYNTDFNLMIDCSTLFALGGADFADECIADIAIMDGATLTGYWSLYATRSGLNVSVTGKLKNASGVVVTTFSQGAAITIDSRVEPSCYLCFAKNTINNYTIYGLYFNFNQHWEWAGQPFGGKAYAGCWLNDDRIYEFFGITGHIDSKTTKRSPHYGYASEDEGYTGYDFDDSSDLITPDPAPRYGVSSPGFVHVYSTTPDGLALFGEALFPEPASATTTEDLLNELNKILFNGKMIDYVLDTHIIPFMPTIGEQERIKLGGKYISTGEDTYLYGYTVASDYEDIDCGTLSLPLKFKNFLDFNVQCKLFLPFVGFVSIPPEYWIGGTIGVKYRFNVIDGSFVCFVTGKAAKSNLDGSIVGQYSGSACIHIPITGASYASLVSGLVSTVGGVAAGAAAGGAIGALSAAAASGLSNIQNLTPDYQQSNGYTGSAAMLGHRTPFLLIEFPVPQFSEMFPDEIGLPLNVAKSLSSVSGFTIVDASRITVAGASAEELAEIKSLLEKGVIL